MKDIKPCMYCGNKYSVRLETVCDHIAGYGSPRDGELVTVYRVTCDYCHARSAMYERPNDIIVRWNALSDMAFNQGFEGLKEL